jgi:hypothetical protein
MTNYTLRKGITLAVFATSSALVCAAPPFLQPFGSRARTVISSLGGGYSERTEGGAYYTNVSSANLSSSQWSSGASSSRASLANGTLGAFASTERHLDYAWMVNNSGAYFWDTITITSTGQNLGLIPLQFELDGAASGLGTASFSGWVYDIDYDKYVVNQNQRGVTGDVKFDTTLDSELAPLIERHYMVGMSIGADATIDILTVGNTAVADYMNTLHFRWDLPEGVTFKSASGVFNPERITAAPVPEPATMAALCFGVLGLVRSRKRKVSG